MGFVKAWPSSVAGDFDEWACSREMDWNSEGHDYLVYFSLVELKGEDSFSVGVAKMLFCASRAWLVNPKGEMNSAVLVKFDSGQ